MSETSESPPAATVVPRPRRALRRLALAAAILVVLFLMLEIPSRLFWMLHFGTPLLHPEEILYGFYPELRFADSGPVRRGDGEYNVLVLAGSVLNNHYGNVGLLLEERLTRRLRRRVRVHNLARRSHTSLDSFYKYQHLEGQQFDLVLVYHGINEVRANNVPPEMFRLDYSHFSWYATINSFHAHWEVPWVVFPFTVGYAVRNGRERWGLDSYVSPGKPREDWLAYGADVKTAAAFVQNLSAILDIARRRGDPVLLMTFAYYIPADYSEEAFDRLALDYSLHAFPVEFWGRPADVARAIETHNTIVRRLAEAANGRVRFVDQDALMPKDGKHFNDVCHLTGTGCQSFVDNMIDVVAEELVGPAAGPP